MTAFVANTNFLELIGLMDALTDAYINNASVAVTTIEDPSLLGVGQKSSNRQHFTPIVLNRLRA